MKSKKKILVISSSRSDYSLLKSLIFELKKEKKINTEVIATGSHLEKRFGNTYKEIVKDKIHINKKIFLNLKTSTHKNIISAISLGIKKFFNLFNKKKPDAIVILGDRYEILSVAYAAHILKINIFHFAGGEKTPYVYDDAIRNCLSILSNYHFVAHKKYKKNLIKMGINSNYIFDVGSLGIDNIKLIKRYSKKKILKKYNLEDKNKFFIITYHATTLFSKRQIISETKNLILALDDFKDYNKIFTLPTADFANDEVSKIIINYCKQNKIANYYTSLGSENYLNLARFSELIIGNSSSGISEIPSLKKISLNIGSRQKGRIYGNSVINSNANIVSIKKNIKKALILSKKINYIKKIKNPYGDGNSSKKAVNIIKKMI